MTYNEAINIAMAVAMTDGGLITPVLKSADATDIYTLSRDWADLVSPLHHLRAPSVHRPWVQALLASPHLSRYGAPPGAAPLHSRLLLHLTPHAPLWGPTPAHPPLPLPPAGQARPLQEAVAR